MPRGCIADAASAYYVRKNGSYARKKSKMAKIMRFQIVNNH